MNHWFDLCTLDEDEWGVDTLKDEKPVDTAEDALHAQESRTSEEDTRPVVEVEHSDESFRHCEYCVFV